MSRGGFPGATSLSLNIVDLLNGATPEAGSPARYRLELRNTGANMAVDAGLFASWVLTVLILDDEPMSRTLVPSRGTCAPSGDCRFGDLEPGAFVSVDFSGATKPTLGVYRLAVRYGAANTGQGSQSVTKGSSLAAAGGGARTILYLPDGQPGPALQAENYFMHWSGDVRIGE